MARVGARGSAPLRSLRWPGSRTGWWGPSPPAPGRRSLPAWGSMSQPGAAGRGPGGWSPPSPPGADGQCEILGLDVGAPHRNKLRWGPSPHRGWGQLPARAGGGGPALGQLAALPGAPLRNLLTRVSRSAQTVDPRPLDLRSGQRRGGADPAPTVVEQLEERL